MTGFNVAQAWNDILLQTCMRPDNAKRLASYRCSLAYRDQPKRPGRGVRQSDMGGRLSWKRIVPPAFALSPHSVGVVDPEAPNLSVRRHPRKPNRLARQPSLRIRRAS